MTPYATEADLTDYAPDYVEPDPAKTTALLERATRDVDNLLGPRRAIATGTYAGLKLDPTTLAGWEAEALARATSAQAAYLWRIEQARAADSAGAVVAREKGPDFEVQYATPTTRLQAAIGPGSGLYAPNLGIELSAIAHLRLLTATALP